MAQRLAEKLNTEGKHDKAIKILDKCIKELPLEKIEIDNTLIFFAQEYYCANAIEKGDDLMITLSNKIYEDIRYYHSLSSEHYSLFEKEEDRQVWAIKTIIQVLQLYKRTDLTNEIQTKIESLYK
jgi:hypothetical protein